MKNRLIGAIALIGIYGGTVLMVVGIYAAIGWLVPCSWTGGCSPHNTPNRCTR